MSKFSNLAVNSNEMCRLAKIKLLRHEDLPCQLLIAFRVSYSISFTRKRYFITLRQKERKFTNLRSLQTQLSRNEKPKNIKTVWVVF
jgi:hypothetical protein